MKKDFLEREQLLVMLSYQSKKIEALQKDRHYDRVSDCILNTILLVLTFVGVVVTYKSNFSGKIYVLLLLSLLSVVIYIRVKNAIIRLKKYNDDYMTNEELEINPEAIKHISTESIKRRIQHFVEKEKYEFAVKLRDELKKRIK